MTINDPEVLQDYHDIMIPKAIEYSAGILDYFFRGKLEVVSVVWNSTQYTITVRNQSGQELVTGGKFTVWKDDAGNRSPVGSVVTLNQNVADGTTWQFNFPGPQVTTTTKFIVVYQGTIGLTGGQASDPVDQNIAIAAKQFTVGPGILCPANSAPTIDQLVWVPNVNNDLNLSPSGGDIAVNATVVGDANAIKRSEFSTTLCVEAPPSQHYTVEVSWDLTWTTLGTGFAYSVEFVLNHGTDNLEFLYAGVFNTYGPTHLQGTHTFEVTTVRLKFSRQRFQPCNYC